MKWWNAIRRERNKKQTEIQQINQALLDWKMAVDYFEQVSDPDMVDYAIYSINAAKSRYDYLIKKQRESTSLQIEQAQ